MLKGSLGTQNSTICLHIEKILNTQLNKSACLPETNRIKIKP